MRKAWQKPIICGIYKITSPSNRVYIGQSEDIYERISSYISGRCGNQRKLYYSIKKYGWENHKFEIIHICKVAKLNAMEIYYAKLYNAHDKKLGMNLRECGGSRGRHSEESKKLMSKNSCFRGERAQEIIERIAKKNRGKKRTPETIKNISDAHKGYVMPQSQKDKIAKANSGRVYNKTKIKIVLDLYTGIFYDGMADAAKYSNVNKNTLGCQLRRKSKCNKRFIIV